MIMYYEYCHIFGHKGIFQILLIFFFLPITILLNRKDIYKFWFFGKMEFPVLLFVVIGELSQHLTLLSWLVYHDISFFWSRFLNSFLKSPLSIGVKENVFASSMETLSFIYFGVFFCIFYWPWYLIFFINSTTK